jgi:hypothetical protein
LRSHDYEAVNTDLEIRKQDHACNSLRMSSKTSASQTPGSESSSPPTGQGLPMASLSRRGVHYGNKQPIPLGSLIGLLLLLLYPWYNTHSELLNIYPIVAPFLLNLLYIVSLGSIVKFFEKNLVNL